MSTALKDCKLTVEFRHLQQNAPGGVYVVPESLRSWQGLIFVRRGMYASGIFKFRLEVPEQYNDYDAWPRIQFTTKVYSPLVNADGCVDIKAGYPKWDPNKHYVVTALTFVKKVFYLKKGDCPDSKYNPEAAEAFKSDPAEFLRQVKACVEASLTDAALYSNDDNGFRLNKEHLDSPRVQGLARLLLLPSAADDDEGSFAASSLKNLAPADLVLNYLTSTEEEQHFYDDSFSPLMANSHNKKSPARSRFSFAPSSIYGTPSTPRRTSSQRGHSSLDDRKSLNSDLGLDDEAFFPISMTPHTIESPRRDS